MTDTTLLLQSIIGSHMHITHHSRSDVDTRSVAMSSLPRMISPFTAKQVKAHVHKTDDDVIFELRHFLALLSSGSPSIIDIVYSPLKTPLNPLGEELIAKRRSFIDAERTRKNILMYGLGMQKQATKGIRPLKSLRSAILTANVVLCFLENEPYNPLTALGRTAILDSIDGEKPTSEEELRAVLRYVLDLVGRAKTRNEFDAHYVEEFNYRAYTEGIAHV